MAEGDFSRAQSSEATSANSSFTPAQRIAELNQIDRSLSTLLASASEAVGILANKRNETRVVASYAAQKRRFQDASQTYFATLSSIDVGLKRQVYALEEAGLVEAGEDRDVKKARAVEARFDGATGGGVLDSSWLNARADNSVEENMERQIVEETRQLLAAKKDGSTLNESTVV